MARKTEVTLTQTRIFEGWWEGVLTGSKVGEAAVEAWHQDRQIEGVEVLPLAGKAGQQAVRVPIPAFLLTEELMRLGSAGLFRLKFPDHPWAKEMDHLARRMLARHSPGGGSA